MPGLESEGIRIVSYADLKGKQRKLLKKHFKREIFPKLRRAFEAPTKLRIPISTEIREDLHAMRQVVKNGEYNCTAPRTAEGHSDRCTALALALRAAGDGRYRSG